MLIKRLTRKRPQPPMQIEGPSAVRVSRPGRSASSFTAVDAKPLPPPPTSATRWEYPQSSRLVWHSRKSWLLLWAMVIRPQTLDPFPCPSLQRRMERDTTFNCRNDERRPPISAWCAANINSCMYSFYLDHLNLSCPGDRPNCLVGNQPRYQVQMSSPTSQTSGCHEQART